MLTQSPFTSVSPSRGIGSDLITFYPIQSVDLYSLDCTKGLLSVFSLILK